MAENTGKFISKFKPLGLVPEDAKELLLKDAEYSTPQDHYFAHVQTKKQLELEREQAYEDIKAAKEMDIMTQLYDSNEDAYKTEIIINQVIEARREKTSQEIFNKISETDKIKLMEKYKLTEEEIMAEF